MDCYVTVIILILGLSFTSCSRFPPRVYFYIELAMTWNDAQHYCRESFTDLATFESMDDINMLQPNISYSWAWIGLKDDPISWKPVLGTDKNSWRWSATGETSQTGYRNWDTSEPNNAGAVELCAVMGANEKWNDISCQTLQSFVCYDVTDQNEITHVFILPYKTWPDAQAYCRQYYTDLATIESVGDNSAVYSAKPAIATVWIGLYRIPWTWSDQSQSSFRHFKLNSPNNYLRNQYCMAENILHEWDDDNCGSKLPFICHQVTSLETTLSMTIKTDADLTDPAINNQILQQLGAMLTSQGWTNSILHWRIQPRKVEKLKVAETQWACT